MTDPFKLYARTTLFAEALARCPLDDPEAFIAAVQQVDIAPNPAALSRRDDLAAQIEALYDALAATLGRLRVTLGPDGGARLQPPPEPLRLARALPRWIVVEVDNRTGAELTLGASFAASSPDPAALTALPPDKVVPLLVKLTLHDTAQTEVALTLSGGPTPEERTVAVPVAVAAPARLKVMVDAPSTVRVRAGQGGALWVAPPPGGANTLAEKATLTPRPPGTYRLPFFYTASGATLELPPGPVEVTVERGFEFAPAVAKLVLEPGQSRTVRLAPRRFADLRRDGWIGGDTHVHWVKNHWSENEDLRLLQLVQRAEDLPVVNNLILKHRNGRMQVFTAPSQLPVGPVRELSDRRWHVEMGEEYRNEGLYGHMVFLGLHTLIAPISTGPGILGDGALDWPLNRTAILAARRQGALSIEAHQLPFEQPANLIDGLTDSLDQLDPEMYYKVLDCGFRLPLTNGSDHPARTVGVARCYVRCDGPFTYARWLDGIRKGRTFTTSGPLLSLRVNGADIGDEIRLRRGEPLRIVATCRSRRPIGRFQIVTRGGQVLAETVTEARSATLERTLPADVSRWIAARAQRGGQGNAVLAPDVAHTSAVYALVDGAPIFSPDAARFFADHLRRHAQIVRTRGRFADDRQRDAALKVILDAAQAYERKIQESPR